MKTGKHGLIATSLMTILAVLVSCGKQSTSSLEVACFKGGYGIDFFEQAAREYESQHPGVKIKVWGNPRVWEQLRPRFVAGYPPDLTYPGWGIDQWALVFEGQVISLDEYLDSPPYGKKEGKWRDTFEPSLLELCQYQGKTYMLPYFFSMLGWWYNKDMFEKNGWAPPRTWSELLTLCEKIKAKGIAPITYQGIYPAYAVSGFLIPWAISAGGIEAFDNAQNLVPGAWKSPAFLKAAQMMDELRRRGYFQEGANGMDHTGAQMEFISGRAAMIPCGTWLHSEMRNVLPPNFRMGFLLPPVLDDGKGDLTAVGIGIEPWMVPTKGKNPELAIDFYKYMTSLEKAKQFVEQKGTLMSIRGSDQTNFPEYLKEPVEVFRRAKTVWSVEYRQWYPKLGKEVEDATSALLAGNITPQQFVERLERAAEATRQDKNIPKHTYIRGKAR